MILDYINDPDREETEGVWLMALLTGILSLKLAFFTMNFNVGLQTAIRLSGATVYLGFSKFLRLAHVNDKALAQLITCCTSDQERIAESVVIAVLFAGKCTKSFSIEFSCQNVTCQYSSNFNSKNSEKQFAQIVKRDFTNFSKVKFQNNLGIRKNS